MSTIAADVLDRSPYAAPEADLRIKGELTEDKFFGTEGRIGVMRYNARIFQGILMMVVSAAVTGAAVYSENTVAMIVTAVPSIVAFIAAIVLMVNSSIKRLHDLNLSGWYYLIGMIPLVGAIWMLYYALKPGDEDDNKFGPIREASKGDKVMGIVGILFTVLITIGSVLPSSFYS